MMYILETQQDNYVILSIKGRLDTTNYGEFEKKVLEMIEGGKNRIIVNCEELDYISSSGLRVMLMALKKISVGEGKFLLCHLQDRIREIFEISGFNSIFEIFETQEDAVGHLG